MTKAATYKQQLEELRKDAQATVEQVKRYGVDLLPAKRKEAQTAMRGQLQSAALQKLRELRAKVDVEAKQLDVHVRSKRYPNFTAPVSGLSTERLYAAQEFNSAMAVLAADPFPVEVTESAIALGRTDFVSAVADKAFTTKTKNEAELLRRQKLFDMLTSFYRGNGVSELQVEQQAYGSLLAEIDSFAKDVGDSYNVHSLPADMRYLVEGTPLQAKL